MVSGCLLTISSANNSRISSYRCRRTRNGTSETQTRHFLVNSENLGCSFFHYPSHCLPPVVYGQNCTGCSSLPLARMGMLRTRVPRLQSSLPAFPKVCADLPPRLVLAPVFRAEPRALRTWSHLVSISNWQRLKSPTKSVFSHSNSKIQEKDVEELTPLPCRPLLLFLRLS